MSREQFEQQFLQAFEAHADALFRHGFFRIGDKERARDLVQDTFMKTWEYIRGGKQVNDFRPFLYKTLNNLIIDEYRKKKSVSLDALLEEENVSEGNFPELQTGGLQALEAELDGKLLLEELQHMPESYARVVALRYLDELKPKEIAEMLGERENVVSVRIYRGLAWLRKHLEKKQS